MKKYEKAVFYMDAAVSEDIRKTIEAYNNYNKDANGDLETLTKKLMPVWINHPAAFFFTLSEKSDQAARPVTLQLKEIWSIQIIRFNHGTASSVQFEDFIEKFIKKLAENSKSRIIITALYSFLL